MTLARRIVLRWLQLAALATGFALLVYLVSQQIWRHQANDPQIQMAEDAAAMLSLGRGPETVVPASAVDIGASLAPFTTVFDDGGRIVASSGQLHGQPRSIPAGVLDEVRRRGESRVTWQPEPGVRLATVVLRYSGSPGGFVLVGRSLRETEQRVGQFQQLIGLAWAAILVGLLVVVAATERLS
jgi:hypothetical protein